MIFWRVTCFYGFAINYRNTHVCCPIFRKLPKVVRQTGTGMMLDLKMKQFKGVVPLMVSLKNEAMRERHWKELMKKTGKPPVDVT